MDLNLAQAEGGNVFTKKRIPVFLLIVLLLLSACSSTQTNTSAKQPIKIGVSLSLTGDNSSDGQATKQGYQLWQDFVNSRGGILGRQVQMDFLNDATNPGQTRTNYEHLISINHDNFVVGPFGEDFTVSAAETAARHGYALVEGIGTSPHTFGQGLKNLFSVSLSATAYLRSFDNFILSMPQTQRPKTIAFVTSDDPFTLPQVQSAKVPLLVQGTGIKTVYDKVFPAETTDYNPIAQGIVNANPDAVMLGTVGLQDCAAFLQYFKQQHFNPKVIIATAGPDQGAAFVKAMGGANATEGMLVPNDGWFPTLKSYQNDQFVPAYLKKFGGTTADISSDSVQAFATGQVLDQAITQANSLENQAVMTTLRANTFRSIQGIVKFGSDGEDLTAIPFLFQWQKGQLVPVYPPNNAQANVEFPKPKWP
jgi:branched-chain amino acid transport system substrate-binding protein